MKEILIILSLIALFGLFPILQSAGIALLVATIPVLTVTALALLLVKLVLWGLK